MSFDFEVQYTRKVVSLLACFVLCEVLVAVPTYSQAIPGGREFHKTWAVSLAEPVKLKVQLLEGDLELAYSRDGEVSFTVLAQSKDGATVPDDFFVRSLTINNSGNRIEIEQQHIDQTPPGHVKLSYRLDVPYRTEVESFLKSGKQGITGVLGPVTVQTDTGNIRISYVSMGATAQAAKGDIDLQVIGGQVNAQAGEGNISCIRTAQEVNAETGRGDISLLVVGPSTAAVKRGTGRIDVGGVKGKLVASTDAGDLHVKAVPHDDWRLSTTSGTVHIELPPDAKFDLDARTESGELMVGRDDLDKPRVGVHSLSQKANGGGKRIEVRSDNGTIVIS